VITLPYFTGRGEREVNKTSVAPVDLPDHVDETIRSMARLQSEHHENATFQQRAVGYITGFLGQPMFAGVFAMTIARPPRGLNRICRLDYSSWFLCVWFLRHLQNGGILRILSELAPKQSDPVASPRPSLTCWLVERSAND
jgi:hypothetical protein